MSFQDEQAKILDMVARGKITAEEADMLLNALVSEKPSAAPKVGPNLKNHYTTRLSNEHKLQIGVAGVSPEFLRAVRQLNLPNLSGEDIVQMAVEGVSPTIIRELAAL